MPSGFHREELLSITQSDGKVKLTAADVAGYLSDKLAAGANITLTVGADNIIVAAEIDTAIANAVDKITTGHVVHSDGVAKEQRSILDFVGSSVTVIDDPAKDTTTIEIANSDGHVIYVNSDSARPQRAGLKFVGSSVTFTDDPANGKSIINIQGSHVVNADGTPVTQRTGLNFVGTGVVVSDDSPGDKTTITINKHVIQEEGGALPDRANLNFAGAGVTVTDDAEGDTTLVTIGGGEGTGLVVTIPSASAELNCIAGQHYVCNGVTTANLPAGVQGAMIGFADYGKTFAVNPLTIVANAGDTIVDDTETELVLDRNGATIILGFTQDRWVILAAEVFRDLGVSSEGVSSEEGGAIADGDKGDIIVSNGGGSWLLDTTAVTPGSYTFTALTVDAKGRITAASSGDPYPDQTGNTGKYLTTDGSVTSWAAVDAFPDQTGNTGKYLSTDGSVVNWSTVDALPDQTGNTGKYLTTDGSVASWVTPDAGGHTIQEEGTPLTQRTNLNFVGSTVTVTDDAGNDATVVTVATPPTINWLGAWDNATNYIVDDAVSYQGSSYIANAPSLNKIPGTDIEWDLLASKGDTGATGAAGATGSVSSASSIILAHIATPSDPGAGNTAIYAKSDNKLYILPTGGSETEVGAGASAYSDLTDVDTTGLAVGQAMIWNGTFWVPGSTGREVLTANRTYYVRTDGSDSNDGLSDIAGGAFLTIQKAIDVVAGLDISIYDVTIQLADGTYTIAASIYLKPPVGSGTVYIKGNSTTPSNVHLTGSTQSLIVGEGANTPLYHLKDFKLSTGGAAINCIRLLKNFSCVYSGLDFGACSSQHINCLDAAICFCGGNYTISGGAGTHWGSYSGSAIRCQSKTITITGTPAFSASFVAGGTCGQFIVNGNTYSGSATGVYYSITGNSILQLGGDTLPGNSAGTIATGAQVV